MAKTSYPVGRSGVRPIEIGGFVLDTHGARPASEKVRPTKHGWLAVAGFVKHVEVACPYWVGDLLLWLEENSGWDEHVVEQLTSEIGWARQTIYNHTSVARHLAPKARAISPSFSHSRVVAQLPPKQQVEVLEVANEQELTATQTQKLVKRKLRPRIIEGQAALDGMYRVILADCPWIYANDRAMPDGSLTPAHDSYEGMTVEQLSALPVEAHTMKNAVLFQWATNAHLNEALAVGHAWGFTYKTNWVWNKVKGRPGPYGYMHHELLLIFTRGACTPDVPILQHDHASILTERREGEHSQKPRCVRKQIVSLYPEGPYLELFAREQVRGWTCFGNDARLWAQEASA